jgi:hypothetical protein
VKKATILTLALGLAALAGCHDIVDPVFPVEEHRMVVIPFRGPDGYYFDSNTGAELAHGLDEHLAAKRAELGPAEVIDVVPFEDLVAASRRRNQDPKDVAFADWGRMTNADLVLVGDITQFQSKIPGDVGFSRGRAIVNLKVIEVAKPDRAMYKKTITVAFPPENKMASTGILEQGGQEEVRAGLMLALVDEISKLFYPHEVEKQR